MHNTHLIPRPIAEILLHFDVKELHVSLTQGLWRYENWGYPVVDTAPGAEVWAWFGGSTNLTETDVDLQWIRLASTFSGILCSSLNFIDGTNSMSPKYGFRPRFSAKPLGATPNFIRYATLPREIVCTENLTPWKKLLPCNSKDGFASLLNSGHVHNTNFHALSISLRTICLEADKNCILEFTESANLVYDPKILGSNDFSLRRMFGQGLNGYCALAKTSKIYVALDESRYDLSPTPQSNTTSTRGGSTTHYGIYDMQLEAPERLFNVAWIQKKNQNVVEISPLPPISSHRYILGQGQERGVIVTQIINSHYSPLPVILQENIPWYVPIYIHTLKLSAIFDDGKKQILKPKALHYIPGVQRVRPYHLELAFELPPKSTVEVSFDFDYIFLKWLEYPPDANHGHYLGSAVISTQLPLARNYTAIPVERSLFAHSFNATRSFYFLEIRTESLILSLPTPDFSMPYNVICLACTVVALAFGPIHSVATKKIVIETGDEPHTMFGKLKQKLFKKRKSPEEIGGAGDGDLHEAELLDAPDTFDLMHEKSE